MPFPFSARIAPRFHSRFHDPIPSARDHRPVEQPACSCVPSPIRTIPRSGGGSGRPPPWGRIAGSGVAGDEGRRVGRHTVDPHRAAAHAPHAKTRGFSDDFELVARDGATREGLDGEELARALPRKHRARGRSGALAAPEDVGRRPRGEERDLSGAARLADCPRDDEREDAARSRPAGARSEVQQRLLGGLATGVGGRGGRDVRRLRGGHQPKA